MLRQLGGWSGKCRFPCATELLTASRSTEGAQSRHSRRAASLGGVGSHFAGRIPDLALLPDGRNVCPDGRAGMTVAPDFMLSESQARESMAAGERLNAIMEDTSRQNGWTFIASHREKFQGRGICSGYTDNAFSMADDLRMPRWTGKKWEPFNPADWQAYVPRQRWFRTPNDAFMTGNFHVSESLLQRMMKAVAVVVPVAAGQHYSGASIRPPKGRLQSPSVVIEARRILAKYGAQ